AAHPAVERVARADGQAGVVQLLLAVVVETEPRPIPVPARGEHQEVRVLDVDIGMTTLVQAQDGPAVVVAIEPAQQRAPQARVLDLLAFVPQPALAIEPDSGLPEAL